MRITYGRLPGRRNLLKPVASGGRTKDNASLHDIHLL